MYAVRPTQFSAIFGFAHSAVFVVLDKIVAAGVHCYNRLGLLFGDFFLLLFHCVASRTHSICCCCVSLHKHQSFMYSNFIKAFRVLYVVFTHTDTHTPTTKKLRKLE